MGDRADSRQEPIGRRNSCFWKTPDRSFGVGIMRSAKRPLLGAVMLALLAGCSTQPVPPEQSPGVPEAAGEPVARASLSSAAPTRLEQWMGIYLQGQRAGTTHLALEPVAATAPLYAEGLRYRFVESLSVQGLATETVGWLREDFSLGRFRFEFQGPDATGGRLVCSGHVEETPAGNPLLKVAVESEGTVTEREFVLEEPCYLSSASHLPALRQSLRPGAEFTWLVFDPVSQSLAPMSFRVEGRGQRTALGQTYEAAKIVMTFQGIEQISWMTDRGLRLRDQALENLMVAEIESAEEASQVSPMADWGSDISDLMLNLIDELKVQLQGRIPQPRRCKRLLLEVSGISPRDVVVDGYWQRLIQPRTEPSAPKEGFQIEIALRPEHSPDEPLEPYLEAGFLVQADAPAIVEQASRIVQGLATDREKAARLCQWVFDELDRSSVRFTLPSAVEVLNSRKGDCNEHATLFAALARAAGLATKIAVG
ncbi:MAG TPA: transglutaminase domain-containing protein, partial [Firmicutes bacterium]|nr:transglutaminase domain-containing protein [Bacillota bacterium]